MMHIAVYCQSEAEQNFIDNQLCQYKKCSINRVTVYTNAYDLVYDIEIRQHVDIIIMVIHSYNDLVVWTKKMKSCIPDVVLICLSHDKTYAPKALEFGIYRYIIIGERQEFLNALSAAVSEAEQKKRMGYVITTSRFWIKIPIKDILYCYKDGKMSVIVTSDSEYRERISLYRLYERFKEISNDFLMIERGQIVCLPRVRHLEKNHVYLDCDLKLAVGRTFYPAVKSMINNQMT